MSIKKGEKITASEISSLKRAVLDIYAARPYLGGASTSGAQYTVSSIDENSSGFGSNATDRAITTGNTINANFYYALNALLLLNDVKTTDTTPITIISSSNTTGDYIFKDVNENKDLMTIVNDWKNLGLASTAQPISCRGGCVGLCWNKCDGECTYACVTGNNSNNGDTGGSWDGQGSTGSNCGTSCTGRCKTTCTNWCYHTCETGCGTSCGNSCSGGCKTGCSDDCAASCGVGAGTPVLQ